MKPQPVAICASCGIIYEAPADQDVTDAPCAKCHRRMIYGPTVEWALAGLASVRAQGAPVPRHIERIRTTAFRLLFVGQMRRQKERGIQ
jgi:hypothetical protein